MSNPTKTLYRVNEVTALLDIPAHTLRFWEREFPMLNSERTDKGQRRYTQEQVDMARRIKQLLYDNGLKIEAAIKVLRKYPPRHPLMCESSTDALRLLKAVKNTLDNAHLAAKIEAV